LQYNYEALDPETFQKLAQAVIVASHPETQCLPVGQPDGGRDAFYYFDEPDGRGFVVFQIKFSRNPDNKDEKDAVQSLIKTEKDKVDKLISMGAERYYLITNIKGSAHLEVGSIEKVQSTLFEGFDIPSMVWWRDDLDARIDNSIDIKWSYPQICRASDVLGFLLKEKETDEDNPAARTISGYFAKQYTTDRDVKFKQVELKRRLTDLFVDLPIGPKTLSDRRGKRRRFHSQLKEKDDILKYVSELSFFEESGPESELMFPHQGRTAAFFLQQPPSKRVARFVLEGAPGQGKSTVSQYICQINRLRFLKKIGRAWKFTERAYKYTCPGTIQS